MSHHLGYLARKPASATRHSRNTTFAWYLIILPPGLSALAWSAGMAGVAGAALMTVLITWPLAIIAGLEGLKFENGPRAISALVASAAGAACVWCGLIYVLATTD